MKRSFSIPFLGFLQATGLAFYLVMLSTFFTYITPKFMSATSEFYAPIIMLMLFIISAVITALLVLGKAGVMAWNKEYINALKLVFWTLGWSFLYAIFFMFMLTL